jgi:hypothetical protein
VLGPASDLPARSRRDLSAGLQIAPERLLRHESGLQQFRPVQYPYFSRDNLGRVGICQITNPRPTDDQVWSWKENLKRGLQLYKEKENVAKSYPRRVRERATFNSERDELINLGMTFPAEAVVVSALAELRGIRRSLRIDELGARFSRCEGGVGGDERPQF